mmetsp:Transcript_5182/g.12251  ORF Transcript_5182/g.12251 Transcript_5182/m.12251 type:complete len:200 (-) Transcript_5182:808-1407(-)
MLRQPGCYYTQNGSEAQAALWGSVCNGGEACVFEFRKRSLHRGRLRVAGRAATHNDHQNHERSVRKSSRQLLCNSNRQLVPGCVHLTSHMRQHCTEKLGGTCSNVASTEQFDKALQEYEVGPRPLRGRGHHEGTPRVGVSLLSQCRSQVRKMDWSKKFRARTPNNARACGHEIGTHHAAQSHQDLREHALHLDRCAVVG